MNSALTHKAPPRLAAPPPVAWRPSRTTTRVAFLIGLSLLSGFAFRNIPEAPPIETTAIISEIQVPIETPWPPLVTSAPAAPKHHLAVDLDEETQDGIWEACRENRHLYCMVMAIARKETIFNPNAIGDSGNSIGLLQIQPRWHQDRMDRLGVTDLTDPVQNARVAVDFIDWIANLLTKDDPKKDLEDAYGTHELLMAYNQGWNGANRSWDNGIYATDYSRSVMDYYDAFLAELEAGE